MALPAQAALLLHNPRCSKSRQARALLEERGVEFQIRAYLEEPLDQAELEDLRRRLDRPVREWTRQKESEFAEAGLDASASEKDLIEAIAAHPILLERPILVRGPRAVVGRPPENVLELVG